MLGWTQGDLGPSHPAPTQVCLPESSSAVLVVSKFVGFGVFKALPAHRLFLFTLSCEHKTLLEYLPVLMCSSRCWNCIWTLPKAILRYLFQEKGVRVSIGTSLLLGQPSCPAAVPLIGRKFVNCPQKQMFSPWLHQNGLPCYVHRHAALKD